MKNNRILFAGLFTLSLLLPGSCTSQKNKQATTEKFKPTPESLRYYQVPQWYNDAKFGIYFHWSLFSVPAFAGEWYPHWMYYPEDAPPKSNGTLIHEHHVNTWGPLDTFGYKDFIPMFRAEKWDPEAWVKLFKDAGAKYLVSAAVHHDGFALWDSKYISYNAAKMGPQRDIVGDYLKAVRAAGLKTGVATHYGRHWKYYYFRPEYDNWDPAYEGLYGHRRGDNDPPRPEDEQHWQDVMTELIDTYQPDYIFVDGGIRDGERDFDKPYFRQQFYNVLAHYYNSASDQGKEVVLTYKKRFLEPDQAVEDFERAGLDSIRNSSKWQTDDKIAEKGWCYVENSAFKSAQFLIAELADVVSKNGNLLLNVGPKPDGTLRMEEVNVLKAIGSWMDVNGEAIYGTVPWRIYGENPVKNDALTTDPKSTFNIDPGAVRFTVKDNMLYAICLGRPAGGKMLISSVNPDNPISEGGIASVSMLGINGNLKWEMTEEGLETFFPDTKPCDNAFVMKIVPDGKLIYN